MLCRIQASSEAKPTWGPAVREREAEACRQAARRRRENPAVLEREAEAARQRRVKGPRKPTVQ
mgnify:CR=1 FL=1